MEPRPVAIAATSSISTSLLWLIKDWLLQEIGFSGFSPPLDLPDISCPDQLPIPLNFWVGLIVGILCWPVLELVVLSKQWLTLVLRARIANLGSQSRLYKVIG